MLLYLKVYDNKVLHKDGVMHIDYSMALKVVLNSYDLAA